MSAAGSGFGRRRAAYTIVGLVISGCWLTLVALYIGDQIGWENLALMLPHEIGFTLAGVFAPLAFVWLFLIYLGADSELSDTVVELRRRLDQLVYPSESSAARVEAVTKSLREQAEQLTAASEAAATEAERIKERLAAETRGLIEASERMTS